MVLPMGIAATSSSESRPLCTELFAYKYYKLKTDVFTFSRDGRILAAGDTSHWFFTQSRVATIGCGRRQCWQLLAVV